MHKRIIIICLLMLSMGIGYCQTANDSIIQLPSRTDKVALSATIDTGTMVLGEQRLLHIKATNLQKGKQMPPLAFPSLQMMTNDAIEALTCHFDTTQTKDGIAESIEQVVTLAIFDTGRHAVPGVVLMAEEQGTATTLAPDDSLFVEGVYAATADTTKCEVRADAPFQKESLTVWDIARWILLIWGIVIVVGVIMIIIQSKKNHKPIPFLPKPKPVPADRKALNELESLRRKELWQKGRIKKYYTDMTDIVRRFLHNMYGISAAEMTTRQTLRAFHTISDWSEESESLLRQLLNQADMVKFAKSEPATHEHDLAMQNAINFVRKVAETHTLNNPVDEKAIKQSSTQALKQS